MGEKHIMPCAVVGNPDAYAVFAGAQIFMHGSRVEVSTDDVLYLIKYLAGVAKHALVRDYERIINRLGELHAGLGKLMGEAAEPKVYGAGEWAFRNAVREIECMVSAVNEVSNTIAELEGRKDKVGDAIDALNNVIEAVTKLKPDIKVVPTALIW